MEDTNVMTLGMWVDYIIEWNNLHSERSKYTEEGKIEENHLASQADIDMFLR